MPTLSGGLVPAVPRITAAGHTPHNAFPLAEYNFRYHIDVPMPSSSRAYPMKLEKKADFYRKMLDETGLL